MQAFSTTLYKSVLIGLFTLFCYSAQAQWVAKPLPEYNAPYTVQSPGGEVLFMAINSTFYKSTDFGSTWAYINPEFTNYNPNAFWLFNLSYNQFLFLDENVGYSYGGSFYDQIFKTVDGGVNWTLVYYGSGSGGFKDMFFVSSTVGFAVSNSGNIFKTTNGGSAWNAITSPTQNTLRSIHFTDENNGVIVGNHVILKTTNGGSTWSVTNFPESDFSSVFLVDANKGFAVGSEGAWQTQDGGATWTKVNFRHVGYKIFFTDSQTGFLGSSDGLYKTNDGGKFWALQKNTKGLSIITFDIRGDRGVLSAANQVYPHTRAFFTTQTGGDPVPQNNASVLEVNTYSNELCRGQYPVKSRIVNEGTANLSSAEVQWFVNSVQQPSYQWTGNLAPGDTSELFTVGSYNFNRTARDFNVVVQTSNPNNQADDDPSNDTKEVVYRFNKFSGSYTVGGNDPDFNKISDALNLLKDSQVCDNLVFNLRNGTYTEGVRYTDGWYGSQDYSITFQSESGNPADVTITKAANPYPTNIIHIETKYAVTIRNLSLTSIQSTTGIFVQNSRNVNIENCILAGAFDQGIQIAFPQDSAQASIRNNHIQGGKNGIAQWWDNHTVKKRKISIDGNTIEGQSESGIKFYYSNADIQITNNKILASQTSDQYVAISLDNIPSATLINNYVEVISNVGFVTGIYCYTGLFKMYYNSVYVKSTRNGAPLRLFRAGNSIVQNNNMANYGNGPVCFLSENDSPLHIDYNNVYSASQFIGETGETWTEHFTASDLASWQAVSGHDLHSISVDPQMVPGSSQLQLSTSNYALNGTANPIDGITKDIGEELRNVTSPDIGADEFTIPTEDVAVVQLVMNEVNCGGITDVKVRLHNYGQNTISNFSINWKVDGIEQTAKPISDEFMAGESKEFTLGTYNLSSGSHAISIHLSVPGDLIARNDTLTSTLKSGGMSGTFTIGGANPDYSTITSAINDLASKGACGNVIFNIRSGIYNEQVVIPQFPGASELNQVVFQSETLDSTSVTIEHSATAVVLHGADWVTLQHVQLKSTNVGSTILEFKSASNHNTLKSNLFFGNYNLYGILSASYYFDGTKTITNRNEYNTIINNRFDMDEEYYNHAAISMSGPNHFNEVVTQHERKNAIIGNVFIANSEYPTVQFHFQDGLSFNNNIIRSPNGKGIYISNCINQYSINGNEIHSKENAIEIACFDRGNAQPSILTNNIVESTEQLAISVRGSNKLKIYNNTIIGSGESMIMGINANYNYYADIVYDQLELKNNIIVNKGSGMCVAYDPKSQIKSDYNVFFTSNAMPFALQSGNVWDPSDETLTLVFDGLSQWQQKTGHDQNSRFFSPRFVSDTDYHINSDPRLKGRGTALGILTDVDGENRNALTPDVGADEFVTVRVPNDVGVSKVVQPNLCGSNQGMLAKIKNYGSNTVTAATINWRVNETIMSSIAWTGSLAPDEESGEIMMGEAFLNPSDSFDIDVWTEFPNGEYDLEAFNDSTTLENMFQKLSGYYTLGGEENDFATFKSASAYLNRVGVCGPVTFIVNSGTYGSYEETISIKEIIGSSSENTVTFMPNEGDTTVVIKGHWTWNFNLAGTDYITFQNLRFEELEFSVTGDAHHIQFLNNRFSNFGTQLKFTSGNIHDVTIENNFFETGSYAIRSFGVTNTRILNNTIKNVNTGIGLSLPKGTTEVLNNKIESTYGDCGIAVGGSFDNLNIQNNQLLGQLRIGFSIERSGSKSGSTIIANNMITGANEGIFSSGNKNIQFYFNSVNMVNQDPVWSMAAFYSHYDSALTVINNSFVNSIPAVSPYTGQVVDVHYLDTLSSTIDYNNVWSASDVYRFQDQVYAFDQYQQVSGFDKHSISVNPLYVSEIDLHVLNPALNGAGVPLSEVTSDIDGDTRDLLHPDIGADEYVTYPANASIASINMPVRYCLGQNDIYATLQNKGLTVLGNATIEWTVNGIQQPSFVWTGGLTTQKSESVKIGSYTFPTLGEYEIKVWSTLPNGLTDPVPENDTIKVAGVSPAASGIYTIGATNPDFATINDAVTMLRAYGVCGPVTFNIRPGIYEEQIYLPEIAGSINGNRIIFQSENGDQTSVVIRFTATTDLNNYVWRLHDTRFVTIRNVSIQALSDDYSRCFYIHGPNHSLQIANNKVIATKNVEYYNVGIKTVMDGYAAAFYGSSIKNNEIIGGSSGIEFGERYEDRYDTSLTGDSIINNTLIDQFQFGISGIGNKYLIQGNTITNSSPKSETYRAINLYFDFRNSTVLNNNIYVYGAGIYAENTYKTTIANNFISIQDGLNYRSHGISLIQCSQIELYYNSVFISDVTPQSAGLYLEQVDLWNGSKTFIRNNIFANVGGGLCFDIYYQAITTDYFLSENNNLYKTGQYYGRRDQSVYYSDLSSWTAYSGQEKNDVTTNPLFVSSTNLHATSNDLIGAAKPVSIITDYDGQTRHAAYPTIGADEFGQLPNYDLAASDIQNSFICDPQTPIKFSIKNRGVIPVTSFSIQWYVNNQLQPGGIWNGNLNFGAETIYSIPTPAFNSNVPIQLRIVVSNPNNQSDQNVNNNTTSTDFTVYPKASLGPDITQCASAPAEVLLNPGTFASYLWKNGQVSPTLAASIAAEYSVTVTDLNGCVSSDAVMLTHYTPTATIQQVGVSLVSAAGDGYQWFFNNQLVEGAISQNFLPLESGLYKVQVTDNGCTAMSNNFEYTVTTSEDDALINAIDYFPNPANLSMTVEYPLGIEVTYALLDNLGKEIQLPVKQVSDTKLEFNTSEVKAGFYYLKIISDTRSKLIKISIVH